ncbi:hypothetical protein HSR121_1575 [Halapricum desulfuricans]|uniref:Uncharacterized protein n=1 Tax=Halapricum desulfuricans TaxID=2841257 RepID=A0A897N3P9_9EURY|nr:hypothetical protein HSR121_1575 [Halapricum desulfuricans]
MTGHRRAVNPEQTYSNHDQSCDYSSDFGYRCGDCERVSESR